MSELIGSKLLIIESPGKIKKMNEILGKNYVIKASIGHIQDLDKKTLSIDIENNFKPYYVICEDKKKVVFELQNLVPNFNDIYLATDEDREGEAIAFSLSKVLNLVNPKRITFNQITKTAILNALQNPRTINYNLVTAQQTRRLLDRLVGYKISPILYKHINDDNNTKSAGRVQSVVIKIINDKEEEINNTLSDIYLKTQGIFENNSNIKIIGLLDYIFTNIDTSKDFLNLINKNTIVKVIDIENKKSIKKPSPPFITSTLQQDASTKLHFSIKKTMEIAQKLYEKGLITYMRTDSPSISDDALNEIKKYILKNYDKKYLDIKKYESKNINAQEAHECIRPTHIDNIEINLDKDSNKLYNLIWKRTIASQMSNAIFNVQIIKIDLLNNLNSILIFDKKQKYFINENKNIDFDGFLIIYDNLDSEDNNFNNFNINVNDLLKINKITISQEYTKLPLRYNEANLIKFLEKKGIGRPSTYTSIISKIIDRKYVEIKNIEGINKVSKIIELNNKFKIKEMDKNILIGKENKKIVLTELGKKINNFMINKFDKIIDINFTANFESYLDKIALGQANWITVLKLFYDMFNPIIETLLIENTDKLLGKYQNKEIYVGTGKYGPYIKYYENNKWNYNKIDNTNITINDMELILEYPKYLGLIDNNQVYIYKGQYGFYIKYLNKNISIKEPNINIDNVKQLIECNNNLKTFNINNKIINLKKGYNNYYLQIINNNKRENISIPKKYNINNLNDKDVINILKNNKI